jgi:hypothetical protein
MPNLWLIKNNIHFSLFIVLSYLALNHHALAETKFSGQVAAGSYSDESLTAKSANIGVTSEFTVGGESNEYLSAINLGYNHQQVKKSGKEASKKVELQGGDKLESKTYSLNLTQAVGLANTVQVIYSTGYIGSYKSKSQGLGFQRWLLMDRLRAGFVAKKNESEQEIKNLTDLDGKRIITPDHVTGDNYQANLMSYISNTTIGLADVSYTTRNDRPPTWSTSLQARQYVAEADGSLHLGVAHFENVGSIKPITTYGSIVANTANAEWHQKLNGQYILMGGYRFYMENERPRGENLPIKEVGSDYIYTTARYRFSKGWTYRSNEISLSYGHYMHNTGLSGNNLSLGVDWLI